MKFKVRRI